MWTNCDTVPFFTRLTGVLPLDYALRGECHLLRHGEENWLKDCLYHYDSIIDSIIDSLEKLHDVRESIQFHGDGRSESESAVIFVVTGRVDRLLCGFHGGRNQAQVLSSQEPSQIQRPMQLTALEIGNVSILWERNSEPDISRHKYRPPCCTYYKLRTQRMACKSKDFFKK